jgi:2-methylisocitrate lyase-like PEP mutase family enzyme
MTLAQQFADLHQPGAPLLLANAWDAASAAAIEHAGAKAIATTSAGVAWSLGEPDDDRLGADSTAQVVRRIVKSVSVPVSVDVEAGYGPTTDDVRKTVGAIVGAGAVGINIEDRRAGPVLFEPTEQAERLTAAREGAGADECWINVRTDVFLSGQYGSIASGVEEVLRRAPFYKEAGADSLFVPGLVDLDALADVVAGPLPVAVMVWPGAPTVAELAAVGVVRISLGAAIAQAAYGLASRAATELFTAGTYDLCAGGVDYGSFNASLTRT